MASSDRPYKVLCCKRCHCSCRLFIREGRKFCMIPYNTSAIMLSWRWNLQQQQRCVGFLLLDRWGWQLQQTCGYVDARMKWKKDEFYDTVDVLNKSKDLRPLLTLTHIIARSPGTAIPISSVSKMSRVLELPGRVTTFLRSYPSFFHEFTGAQHGLPWFSLTSEAANLYFQEQKVFLYSRPELLDRLRRLILMTKENKLPLQVIQGMHWYLGLPEDFVKEITLSLSQQNLPSSSASCGDYKLFRLIDMGDGIQGLSVVTEADVFDRAGSCTLSGLQKTVLKASSAAFSGEERYSLLSSAISFPLFPSKGVRLKRKIANWLEGFQKLPYLSPYEHPPYLDPSSDMSEKRVVGVLHELLSLFVEHSAERRKILCLRKHLGLPQKFYRAFERHPHIFYLHLKNKTCTVVLKEGFHGSPTSAIEKHPMLNIREQYVRLMMESDSILRIKRSRKPNIVEREKEESAATATTFIAMSSIIDNRSSLEEVLSEPNVEHCS